MQTFTIEMTEVPIAGGLTEDPSVLRTVNEFLKRESHLQKVNQILHEDGCVIRYRSLIDCLLVELVPRFKAECFEFYEGKGRPLASLYSEETIVATDVELGLALEVLASRDWASWADFKSNFKAEIKWEPL